jgi:hypothetical protein
MISENLHWGDLEWTDENCLLREPHQCEECKKIFITYYPIFECFDHEEEEEYLVLVKYIK